MAWRAAASTASVSPCLAASAAAAEAADAAEEEDEAALDDPEAEPATVPTSNKFGSTTSPAISGAVDSICGTTAGTNGPLALGSTSDAPPCHANGGSASGATSP